MTLNQLRKIITLRHCRRAIALVQLLVMLMLAVPACCFELEPRHEISGISLTAGANDAGQDECPCCPEEDDKDSGNCSTCSYCSFYTPLNQVLTADYAPTMVPLNPPELSTKLSDVHFSIYVPPQNLA